MNQPVYGGKGWLGFPDFWSGQKPWRNCYLTPVVNFGEIRRTQLANLHSLPPRCCPCDLFRSFKVCWDAKERVGCGKQRKATVPIQSLIKQQPWFQSLRWKTCIRQNSSLDSCFCSEGPALGHNILIIYMCVCVWFFIELRFLTYALLKKSWDFLN